MPGTANQLFAGWPALYTLQGPVRTSVGSALNLYNRLKGTEVNTNSGNTDVGAISALSSDGTTLRVLAYSCSDYRPDITTRSATIRISWPYASNKSFVVTKSMVDANNANPRTLWESMGSPNIATASQLKSLKSAAVIPQSTFNETGDSSGNITITTTLNRPAVQLFELVKKK
jgi:hypothetical protein